MGKISFSVIKIYFLFLRIYNLINELNHNPIRWSLIFTISRGHRLLHDVRLLPKPTDPEQYAKDLWTIMLTVYKKKRYSFFK